MRGDAPLETARSWSQGSVRAVALSPLGSARANLEAMVSEEIAQERARLRRADVAEAIARAERGERASLRDLDLDDPADLELYEQSYADVLEDRQGVDRAAGAMLAAKCKHGRWPG
jgi:hypothetical protein